MRAGIRVVKDLLKLEMRGKVGMSVRSREFDDLAVAFEDEGKGLFMKRGFGAAKWLYLEVFSFGKRQKNFVDVGRQLRGISTGSFEPFS